jgi:hypothetical protein
MAGDERAMKRQFMRVWLVSAVVLPAWSGLGMRGDPLPWFGAGAVRAAEAPIWELRAYRVRVLLCADESPLWTNTRLEGLARDIARRGVAELGRAWQMTIEVGTADVRRAALRAGNIALPDFPSIMDGEDKTDKRIIVTLRATAGEPTVEACEYDAASRRWNRGPLRTIGPWNRLNHSVFESLADVMTPLAIVKTSIDDRVVLRLRGGLLPIRNPRRPLAEVGSIFHLVARDALSDRDAPLPDAYLVAEKVDGHLLACRGMGALPNLAGDDAADRWVAVGVRSLHPATEFTLTMASSPAGAPLAGGDIWLSDARDNQGTCLGRTDDRGRIVVAAADAVRWLHVRLGAVVIEQFPVVPGWRARQSVTTHVNAATLATASALNDCHNDVMRFVALGNAYMARCKSRERAGRTAEAQALREEGQKVIQERATQLRQRISERRQRVERLFADQASSAEAQWETLNKELRTTKAQ